MFKKCSQVCTTRAIHERLGLFTFLLFTFSTVFMYSSVYLNKDKMKLVTVLFRVTHECTRSCLSDFLQTSNATCISTSV